MEPATKIAAVSHDLFQDSETVQYYAQLTGLMFGEETLFRELRPSMRGARVLDIGVGAGRTTPFLLECQPARYVGVDYAENMVLRCREKFPGVDFRVMDARYLRDFGDGEFDFTFFSWSGIDYLGHEDRRRVLAEVRRVLAPGARFVFTTANGRKLPPRPWSGESFANMSLKPGLRSYAYGVKEFLVGSKNYFQRCRYQEVRDDYAILVDMSHNFRVLRYFIRPDRQEEQLIAAGFGKVRAVDKHGATRDVRDPSFVECPVCYLCEKEA